MSATESLKRNPSASLLGIQLLGFLLYPLMEASPTGRALFGVFGLLVLGVALGVIHQQSERSRGSAACSPSRL